MTSAFEIPKVNLGTDLFLYSCREAILVRQRKDGTFKSHLRWDPFLFKNYQLPSQLSLKQFRHTLNDVVRHQAQITPFYRRGKEITKENLPQFTESLSTLIADVGQLVLYWTGQELPFIPTEHVEYSGKFPVTAKLIERFDNFRLSESEESFVAFSGDQFEATDGDTDSKTHAGEDLALVFACEIWDMIAQALNEFISGYSESILYFVYWRYRKPEPEIKPDYSVRPPVGEAYSMFMRGQQSSERRSGGGGGYAGKPSRGGSGPGKKDFSKDKRPPRKDGRGGGHDRKPRENKANGLDAALDEVREALGRMKAEPGLSEILLKPTNSFLRREQHTVVVENGFNSESRGEGNDRTVVIKRK